MSLHNLDRRTVLRGMLAAVCTLCLPKALWGAAPSSSGTAAPQPSAAPQPGAAQQPGKAKGGKVSKAVAKYQDKPKGDQKCSNCTNFVAPASCKVVSGKISANGWCTLWVKKQV